MMVAKYDMECSPDSYCDGWMDKCENGKYVLAADYAKLESKCDELQRRLNNIKEKTSVIASECNCSDYHDDEQCLYCEYVSDIIAIAEGRE